MASDCNFISKIDVPFVVISIVSPEYEKYEVAKNRNCIETMYLRFHDLNHNGKLQSLNEVEDRSALKLFNEDDALKILEFSRKHKEVKEWIVHCEAGISRSPGVAMALSQLMNLTSSPERFIDTIYGQRVDGQKFIREKHNRLVKDIILKTAKVKGIWDT